MTNYVGFSYFFPLIPTFCFASIVLLVLLLPGFLKTRSVAILSLWGWFYLINLFKFINTIVWRSNTDNVAPIYCDISSTFMVCMQVGIHSSVMCMSRFIWQLSRPSPVLQVSLHYKRNNLVESSLCIIVPLLLGPLRVLTSASRFNIIEDVGCHAPQLKNWVVFVFHDLLKTIMAACALLYCVCAIGNLFKNRHGQEEQAVQLNNGVSRHRFIRLILFCSTAGVLQCSLCILLLVIHLAGGITPLNPWIVQRSLITQVQIWSRIYIDQQPGGFTFSWTIPIWIGPVVSAILFAFFGIGTEAMGVYKEMIIVVKKSLECGTSWRSYGPEWTIASISEHHRAPDNSSTSTGLNLYPISNAPRLPSIHFPSSSFSDMSTNQAMPAYPDFSRARSRNPSFEHYSVTYSPH